MPRPTPREMPGLDALFAELRDADVENLPGLEPRLDHERELGSVLAFATYFTERQKRVVFPEQMEWDEPAFTVVDSQVTVPVKWARLRDRAHLTDALQTAGLFGAMDAEPFLLALDCLDAEGVEFEFLHALYGEPAILPFRAQPPVTSEHRIAAARADGWTPTLKEHNLLPGRSLFIPDDRLGLFLTDPAAKHLLGILLLLPDGNFSLALNPFAKNADADLQYWPQWGRGDAASEWKEVLRVDDQPDYGYHGGLDEPDVDA